MKRLFLILLALLVVVPTVGSAKKKKVKSTCGANSFGNCPKEGCGGDSELNTKKNRTTKPAASSVETYKRADFVKLKFPKKWTAGTKRALLETWGEGTPVEYEAYLIKAKHYTSGMESCNCNLKKEENNDFHLVTVSQKNAGEDNSVTAEISPHIRPAGWTFSKLTDLSKKKTYVKITGYLMLDTQHLGAGPPIRITDWEVHPVTKMQVCTGTITGCKAGNGWTDLEDLPEP
jgi:hypothetical protein